MMPTFVAAAEDYLSVHNGIVEYRVNPQNGRFTIHTAEGLPNKSSDNDKNLLFFWDKPDTSFTTKLTERTIFSATLRPIRFRRYCI